MAFMGVLLMAFMQPLFGLPARARLFVFVVSATESSCAPISLSTLGEPYEALLVIAALLLGELLGRPSELFCDAREAPADGVETKHCVQMNPLTLSFIDGEVEQAYTARKFDESCPLAFASSLGIAAQVGFLTLANPAMFPIASCVAVLSLVLFCSRMYAHAATDRIKARRRYEVHWCVIWVILALLISVSRQLQLIGDLHPAQWLGVCIIYLCAPLIQRCLALSPAARLLVLAVLTGAQFFGTAVSQLGRPLESLLVTAALITGELISHPLELRHRAAFAREVQATGLPATTSEVAATRLLHPLTLCFAHADMERAYTAYSFTSDSHRSVAVQLLVAFVTVPLHYVYSSPPTGLRTIVLGGGFAASICTRVYFHRSADQARACDSYSRGVFTAWLLLIPLAAPTHPPTLVSATSFIIIASLHTAFQFALYQCVHRQARFATAGLLIVVRALTPTVSELGHNLETLIVAAAVINGELLSHPFEYSRRAMFVRKQPACEPRTAARVDPTLSFSQDAAGRLCATRTFVDNLSSVVAGCVLWAAIVAVRCYYLPEHRTRLAITVIRMLTIAALRVGLHRIANQAQARRYFFWGWCVIFLLTKLAIFFAPPSRFTHEPFYADQVSAMYIIVALFLHWIALPVVPRWLTLAIMASHTRWLTLALPYTTLFLRLAFPMLAGELFGHSLDLHRRIAFANTAAAVAVKPEWLKLWSERRTREICKRWTQLPHPASSNSVLDFLIEFDITPREKAGLDTYLAAVDTTELLLLGKSQQTYAHRLHMRTEEPRTEATPASNPAAGTHTSIMDDPRLTTIHEELLSTIHQG